MRIHTYRRTLIFIVIFFLGIASALYFDSIRYNQFFPPKMKESTGEETYNYVTKAEKPYLFLDVRTEKEYQTLHPRGAANHPIAELFDDWKTLPRDKTIYLVCSGGRLSGVAYGYLQLHGFRNIVHVEGGLQKWIQDGLPVEQGTPKTSSN